MREHKGFDFMECDSIYLLRALIDGETVETAQRLGPMQKYTVAQLEEQAVKLLKDPSVELQMDVEPELPFSDEEDMYLLVFKELRETGMSEREFIEEFGHHFRIRRKWGDLKKRLEELERQSEDDVKRVLARNAAVIVSGNAPPMGTVSGEQVDADIARMERSMRFLSVGAFKYDSIAMFANESVVYYMCTRCVVIGLGSNKHQVVVDLRFFDDSVPLIRLERMEITVVFHEDGCFYATNTGKTCFRINGTIIEPGKTSRIPNSAVFDVADVLFVFMINETKVAQIMSDLERKMAALDC